MSLSLTDLRSRDAWEQKGYRLPDYDPDALALATARRPAWVHFGAGNIFRAFLAPMQQRLIAQGLTDTGILVAEGFDDEILDAAYRPVNCRGLNVTLCTDGSVTKEVVCSVTEALDMDRASADWRRLEQVFRSPGLQMASFTITEKGYQLKTADGEYFPQIVRDLDAGPDKAESYIGKIAALAYARCLAGRLPIAFVSMDNCSHNGDRLRDALELIAEEWERRGKTEAGFTAYLRTPSLVAFPWSMIDKITPRPDPKVVEILKADGFAETEITVTKKRSYVAPFVNAEQSQYLVIEDWFPNGRPPLEHAGVVFTARRTVELAERMKVCTCLNPLHTALAIFGCLLGFSRISDEMRDEDLAALVRRLGYVEALPVVADPGILDPKEFLDTVLNVRFPNVFMPDTPQRIATDTSQKLSIRFGETIKAYARSQTLSVDQLKGVALVLAGWCRYLMGIDDGGAPFTPSPDPMLAKMQCVFSGAALGRPCDAHALLAPVLSNDRIFGVDLYESGLGAQVETYFTQLIRGPHAVRDTLHAFVQTVC